jgi:hypothetical protein
MMGSIHLVLYIYLCIFHTNYIFYEEYEAQAMISETQILLNIQKFAIISFQDHIKDFFVFF